MNKENKKNPLSEKELKDFDTSISKCGLPLIWYILKTTTNEEHPLSIGDIYKEINSLISPLGNSEEYFSQRTVRRILESAVFLDEATDDSIVSVNNLMRSIMGGRITYRETDSVAFGSISGKSDTEKKRQKRFYFEPFLEVSDMNFIFTSLQSFRYLSDAEKSYILERLRLLHPCFDYTDDQLQLPRGLHVTELSTLPDRPKKNLKTNMPVASSTMLKNIQFLDQAIRDSFKIELVYGEYVMQLRSLHPGFVPRHHGEPYILNPYALMWNDGECYLIATNDTHSNPVHFRVDRIISVTSHMQKNTLGELDFVPRNPIPESLKEFFIRTPGHQPYFDSIAYANKYPKMQIYGQINKVNPIFECDSKSLQILVDNFGPDIILSDSEDNCMKVQIHGVQYENALDFAFSHSDALTLIGPQKLVDDLHNKLKSIIKKYTI